MQGDFLCPPSVALIQRRGSVPCENLSSSSNRNNNNCNGKAKNRKKLLRRRSGGAEILYPIATDAEVSSSSTWYKFKRSDSVKNRADLDMLLNRRRGSLPVEVLSHSCQSGKNHLYSYEGFRMIFNYFLYFTYRHTSTLKRKI